MMQYYIIQFFSYLIDDWTDIEKINIFNYDNSQEALNKAIEIYEKERKNFSKHKLRIIKRYSDEVVYGDTK